MVLNVEVALRREAKGVMDAHLASLVATSYGLFAGGAAKKHFYMHHVMHLQTLRIVVLRTIKDQVTRLQLVLLQLLRATVELVPLITTSKHKAKLNAKVLDSAGHQRTAVQEKRCVVIRIIRVEVPFCVRNPNVLLTLLHESIS